ncbi:MAG: T9SS type A sorting domain-containing protein [Crocinitomicaceae bacterium]
MKNFYIEERCTQNWNEMPKTSNGTYCGQCSMEVYDFTNKSSEEIRAMLYQFRDKQLCTRMTVEQESTLNREFELWQLSARKHMQRATLFTFLIVFGLSFVSCSQESDKQQIESIRQQAIEVLNTNEISKDAVEITDPTSDEIEIAQIELAESKDTIDYTLEMELDEISVVTDIMENFPEREYVLGGAVMHRVEYVNYLEEVVPEKDKQYDDLGREIPTEFDLVSFPNPTAGLTNLKLEIPELSELNISVHNMSGKQVHDFKTREYYPGTHELGFDLTDHPTGMYLVIVQSEKFKKIVRVNKH